MKIAFIEVQNFRKLRSCRIEFGEKETVFVGANNSGKTSAMDALIMFLSRDRSKGISLTDFTISNWAKINEIGESWLNDYVPNIELENWREILPTLDIWLEADTSELHYIIQIIPTLNWSGGKLGVRLSFESKDDNFENLFLEFKEAREKIITTLANRDSGKVLKIWPNSLTDFLEKKLGNFFSLKAYLLDPAKLVEPENGIAKLQPLPDNLAPLFEDPFKGIFKVDLIPAQRGFADTTNSDTSGISKPKRRLSSQLRNYWDKHLNPSELPEPDDLVALEAIDDAREIFDKKLQDGLKSAIGELEALGYPGLNDPQVTISTELNFTDGLNHDSAVKFSLMKSSEGTPLNFLPEHYNGLGYQNLVYMVFKLIQFRDEWMRVGKAHKQPEKEKLDIIEPIHIVLIEEPEAHLHAQVQQVFIKKAFEVLRKHEKLEEKQSRSEDGQGESAEKSPFTTQLVVSTHSSNIAREIEFAKLRYFKKQAAADEFDIPQATIVNLSQVFGPADDTAKFVSRYLKTTHCDLFFADGAILVEGPAERMLVPHFIRYHSAELDKRYISILEIGGSHAHRLKPLIESLGIFTVVITDLDSIEPKGNSKTQPEKGKKLRTSNDTLKKWHPCDEDLDTLLSLSDFVGPNGSVRIAYQQAISVQLEKDQRETEVIPYTFEDALVFSNWEYLKTLHKPTGLLRKLISACKDSSSREAATIMFEALVGKAKKAEMALDLLFQSDPKSLFPPKYIADSFSWLEEMLRSKDLDVIPTSTSETNG